MKAIYAVRLLAVIGIAVILLSTKADAAFDAGRVTVSTTATIIYTAPVRGGAVRICNRHTTPIFVGPATVTTANGFEIINATCEDFRPFPRDVIYGIVAAATARVDYAAGNYKEP